MKILITGSKGFIGKNVTAGLKNRRVEAIYLFDVDTPIEELKRFCDDCDFVIHLAGVNRAPDKNDFEKGNVDFTAVLLGCLKESGSTAPVLMTSSTHVAKDTPYGHSKKSAEDLLIKHADENQSKILIYRLPNVFGKWCRPNYNSVVATFCHNIANDMPITVNDPSETLTLVSVEDVVREFVRAIDGNETRIDDTFCDIPTKHIATLGKIAELINKFKHSREDLFLPNLTGFEKALYSTYLTYLPTDKFGYELNMKTDERGSFSEVLKTLEYGQVSVNISKPGSVKGNHWHNSKTEKFLVVSGKAQINFRQIGSDEIIKYEVSGDAPKVIDIPPGYTHNIVNTHDTDAVILIWANEVFDPKLPDTYYEEV